MYLRAYHAFHGIYRSLAASAVAVARHAEHQAAAAVLARNRFHTLGEELEFAEPAVSKRYLYAADNRARWRCFGCRPSDGTSSGKRRSCFGFGSFHSLCFSAFPAPGRAAIFCQPCRRLRSCAHSTGTASAASPSSHRFWLREPPCLGWLIFLSDSNSVWEPFSCFR